MRRKRSDVDVPILDPAAHAGRLPALPGFAECARLAFRLDYVASHSGAELDAEHRSLLIGMQIDALLTLACMPSSDRADHALKAHLCGAVSLGEHGPIAAEMIHAGLTADARLLTARERHEGGEDVDVTSGDANATGAAYH